MKRWTRRLLIALPAVLFAPALAAGQGYPEATSQESAEYYRLLGMQNSGARVLELLKYADQTLARSPEHRPVRIARARLLADIGRFSEAAADLKILLEKGADFPGVRQVQLELAHSRGDVAEELAIYRAWSAMKRDPDPKIDMWIPQPGYVDAQIAELTGDLKKAEGAWRKYLDRPQFSAFHIDWADFYLRTGDYPAAAAMYRQVADHGANRPRPDDDFVATAELGEARASWAVGKRDEALKLAMDAMTRRERYNQSRGQQRAAGAALHELVLTAYVLAQTGAGSNDDRILLTQKLRSLAKELPVGERFRWEILVSALGDTQDMKMATEPLTAILKESPQLEWALWSDLFVALLKPEPAERIYQELPAKSVQRAILEKQLAPQKSK